MAYQVVIPARYASTRLPGKLLVELDGKPVIQRVYEQVRRSSAESVIVATDNNEIQQIIEGVNGDVCLTSSSHESGTQRIAEVLQQRRIADDAIIVNVQGDEPFMPVSCIEQVAAILEKNPQADMATLCTPLIHDHEVFDSNVVKVVLNKNNEALYFSRATIPWYRGDYEARTIKPAHLDNTLRHIGIYAYRAGFIRDYINYQPSPLEQIEMLEQLRVLWYGHKIAVEVATEVPGPGIDTQHDLDKARHHMKEQS